MPGGAQGHLPEPPHRSRRTRPPSSPENRNDFTCTAGREPRTLGQPGPRPPRPLAADRGEPGVGGWPGFHGGEPTMQVLGLLLQVVGGITSLVCFVMVLA